MKLDFEKMNGYVMAVVQDIKTKDVLMVGVMNKEALNKTILTKKVTFWSRTRDELWTKGEKESGNFLRLRKILVDCDNDTLLLLVNPNGPTCHTGAVTCFQDIEGNKRTLLFD